MENKRKGGILESWVKIPYYSGGFSLYGKIYGDPRWPSGATLRTSLLPNNQDLKTTTVTTCNTIYRLGNKAK